MTAPVTYEPGENGRWTVAFVMPAEWTMETLPEPNDPNVTLREVAPKRIAAIRFNGGRNPRRFAARQAELMAFLDERGLTAAGDPTFAYYSPPWIPTALRRNEIWVELAEA
jgi:hypothetical protein